MLAHPEDTIVAVSSAAGPSPRAVVRLSGSRAAEISRSIFGPLPAPLRGFSRIAGRVRWAEEAGELPAEAYVFVAPRSYTGQDLVELHTVGAPPVLAAILERAVAAGARMAEPGEFTARAFLAGRLDLTSVEGVAAMIYASSDAQLRAAEQLLHGVLGDQTRRLSSRIADLLSLVEASIDFVDEPIDFLTPAAATAEIEAIAREIESMLRQGVRMERLDARFRVALFGPPNAGKSTLFNRLTGMDRSICSPQPGTTRDAVTAPLPLGGVEAWLTDAAGVGEAADALQPAGEKQADRAADSADAIVLVLDGTRAVAAEFLDRVRRWDASRVVCVINKCDRLDAHGRAAVVDAVAKAGVAPLCISALTGEGCDALTEQVRSLAQERPIDTFGGGLLLNARHRALLEAAGNACGRAKALVDAHPRVADVAELVALELREAAAQLGAIVGEVTTDDVLERIFSRFCIGK